jgi:organic radical activating enzyme
LERLLAEPFWEFENSGICLTGGEPLIQPLELLLGRLSQVQLQRVQVETNGTLLAEKWKSPKIGLVTVSPKKAFSESEEVIGGVKLLEECGQPFELKLVVWDELWAWPWIDWALNVCKTPVVYVQPKSCEKESTALCVQQVKRWNHPNVRLSLQLHKIVGIR